MAAYSDESWQEREKVLGDEAEARFEKWASATGMKFVRYGLARPHIKVGAVPEFIRYTPDYLCTAGMFCVLYEVQGTGVQQRLLLKVDKLVALQSWERITQVRIFLWDNFRGRHGTIPLVEVLKHLEKATTGTFPEGKDYVEWALPDLPIHWYW